MDARNVARLYAARQARYVRAWSKVRFSVSSVDTAMRIIFGCTLATNEGVFRAAPAARAGQ